MYFQGWIQAPLSLLPPSQQWIRITAHNLGNLSEIWRHCQQKCDLGFQTSNSFWKLGHFGIYTLWISVQISLVLTSLKPDNFYACPTHVWVRQCSACACALSSVRLNLHRITKHRSSRSVSPHHGICLKCLVIYRCGTLTPVRRLLSPRDCGTLRKTRLSHLNTSETNDLLTFCPHH